MDTHFVRVHFEDGTNVLSGTIKGGAPDRVDATFARDINQGWKLGVGTRVPDGRVVTRLSAEPIASGAFVRDQAAE